MRINLTIFTVYFLFSFFIKLQVFAQSENLDIKRLPLISLNNILDFQDNLNPINLSEGAQIYLKFLAYESQGEHGGRSGDGDGDRIHKIRKTINSLLETFKSEDIYLEKETGRIFIKLKEVKEDGSIQKVLKEVNSDRDA